MEGTHVWSFHTQQFEFRPFVILRRVDFDMVGLVSFDFLSLLMRTMDEDGRRRINNYLSARRRLELTMSRSTATTIRNI